MALSLPQFNVVRLRSYIFRLPLFTRLIIVLIIALWVVSIQSVWDVQAWGSLIPDETGLATCMRYTRSSFSNITDILCSI
jgi:glycosylphosphatidylinositol transamidase